MSAFYFQRDEDISEKPQVLDVMIATGLTVAVVVYLLEEFWRKVNQRGRSLGDGTGRGLLPGYRLAHLPLLVGLDEPYWQAVAAAGWIEESAEGLLIPKFDDRFGKLAQARAAATMRKQKSRKLQAEAAARATPPRAEPGAEAPRENSETARAADSVSGRKPSMRSRASMFDLLTVADLSICGKLLSWIEDVSVMPRPIVSNNPWYQLRVVASGIHATSGDGVKAPMALFKSIVGRHRWTMLDPEDLQNAQGKLNIHYRRVDAMHHEFRDRVGQDEDGDPDASETADEPETQPGHSAAADLIAGGFGGISSTSRSAGPEELLRWEQKRKSRTA